MKWDKIFLLVFVILAACILAACAQGGFAFAPGGSSSNAIHCSDGGEICINLDINQSFAMKDPVTLKITVTSSKDLSELNVTLHIPGDATVDGPKTWENNLTTTSVDPLTAYWSFPIKAGQPLTFNRVLHFHAEGYMGVVAEAITPGRTMVATDDISVVITGGVGQVFRPGTPLPVITPIDKSGVYGPGTPVPTFCCATNTPVLSQATSAVPTKSSPMLPYPPPASATPNTPTELPSVSPTLPAYP